MHRITLALLLAMSLLLGSESLRAQLPDGIIMEPVATGRAGAVGVRHAGDGSGRVFIIRQGGRIDLVLANGTVDSGSFLNIGTGGTAPPLGFTTGGERGLLGLAFHPSYAVNGRFFVYYTDGSGNTTITEYRVSSSNPDRADPASGQVILRIYQPAGNHNGGDIHFGPDGYLYIGMGDGGGSNDSACNTGQSLIPSETTCTASAGFLATPAAGIPQGNADSRALLGKMLRIDVDLETPRATPPAGADLCGADAATGVARYDIPADNPFAGDSGSNAGACDEIYHYGVRNPFRWSFDRQTGDLIIGDVGQGTWEEIDLVPPGGGRNFGWRICEGFHVRGSTTSLCSLAGRTDPIMAYGRSTGFSTTGGFRYRGPYPTLQGLLFFADYGGALFAERPNGLGAWTQFPTPRLDNDEDIVGFGENEGGTIYMTTLDGIVRRFVLPTAMPGHLTVNKFAQLTTDAGVIGLADPGDVITYTVNALNTGGETLSNLVITDSFESGTPVALTCTPLTLAPNASATCTTYTHVVTQLEFEGGGVLANSVLGVADDVSGDDITATASASVALAPPFASITVAKTATLAPDTGAPGVADVGDTIVYAVTVENTGNVSLDTLEVEDTLAGGSTVLLDCAPTTLAPGATVTCEEYSLVVTQAQVEAQQSIANSVVATALDGDDDPVSDSDEATVAVVPAAPSLVVDKSATLTTDNGSAGVADLGDVISYAVSVTNNGNVSLVGLQVSDQFGAAPATTLSCTPTTLAPQASVNCAGYQHVVTQADIDARVALANVASATATRIGGGAVISDSDDASVAVVAASAGIALAKSAALEDDDSDGYADAGETIAYEFTVTNTGNVTLSGVAVQDAMLGGAVACTPLPLAPQGEATCGPVDYTVTAADMLGTAIENTATASGLPAGSASPVTSATASTSTAVDPGPLIFRDGFESD